MIVTSPRLGRRMLAAVAALSLAVVGVVVAPASPGSATPSVRIVDSCDQTPAAGHLSCFAQRRADLGFRTRTQLAATAATPSGYGPAQLQDAYRLAAAAAGSGTGQRVYVVDAFDDPTAEADLAVYRAQYGLPQCTTGNGCFQKLNQAGATAPLPATDAGWSGEIALDLQMVSAVCPRCGITLVEARNDSDNLFAAVQTATSRGAKFVSMSWGGPEDGTEASYDSNYFSTTGVVYTAATGDDGYAAGVSYPATSPAVVAVGGTSLSPSSTTRGWTESAWNESHGAAGSGCSASEAKPDWQSVVPSSVCSRRANSDVSAVADPLTGVAVYDTTGGNGWSVYGGTSAAAPIIAATYALSGTPAADDRPPAAPYLDPTSLNDVTSGNTGSCSPAVLCTAGPGWDGPTGLGTPNGTAAFTTAGTSTSGTPTGGTPPTGTPTSGTPISGTPTGGTPTGSANVVRLTVPAAQTSVVGTKDTLRVVATDSASAALTYAAAGLPTGLTIDPTSGVISGIPRAVGAKRVTVTATDDTGAAGGAAFTWTVRAATPPCVGTLIANSGFESGDVGWHTSGSLVHRNAALAHRGTHLAWLDGYGRTHHDTLSRTIPIPAGCHATLRYYTWVRSDDTGRTAHDALYVSASGTPLGRLTNRDRSGSYVLHTASLTRFAGHTVTLRFSAYENSSLATAFRIDDVTLTLSR